MTGRGSCLAAIAAWGFLLLPAIAQEAPLESGLTETAQTRLAQIDITVRGPLDRAAALNAEDFRIKINRVQVTEFTLDRYCDAAPASALPDGSNSPDTLEPAKTLPPRAHLLFYFDQPHLTLSGRVAAIQAAETLIDSLIGGGARGMLVSNAAELTTFQTFTQDPVALRIALERMETDLKHLDLFTEQEGNRVAQVVEALNGTGAGNLQQAVGFARMFQRMEARRTERSLSRLAMMLTTLSEVESPKAVIYFADSVRSNAGEHYTQFFGNAFLEQSRPMSTVESMVSEIPFDRVVNEAAAQGVRFYTIKADGLSHVLDPLPNVTTSGQTLTDAGANRSRQQHAQDTLANLARETGGESFVFGVRPKRIAGKIAEDFSCVYLASFDPSPFDEDQALRVKVELNDPELTLSVRGRLVVPSEESRRTSKLLAAFARTDDTDAGFGVTGELVPTGRRGNAYSTLLQIRIPANSLPTAVWEVGASAVEREKVRQEFSGSVSLDRAGTPLIYEQELELAPGDYQITYVAHERQSGLVESELLHLQLPKLSRGEIAVLQPHAFQPESALFLRNDERRSSGPVSHAETTSLDSRRPTALVSLVCGNTRSAKRLKVLRTLSASDEVSFPAMEIDLAPQGCAQIRDLIPHDKLAPGASYEYRIELFADDRPISEQVRSIRYALPGDLPQRNPDDG